VSVSIETSRRREGLSFAHHTDVEAADRPPKRRPPGGNPAAIFITGIGNAPEDKRSAARVKLNSEWGRR
jgi:hypothetical protein